MPLYEYKCKSCNLNFDTFKNINECDAVQMCPLCGEESQKLISSFSFVNKGSEHRDIDCIVGEDSERKWENIYKRKSDRQKKRKENSTSTTQMKN